MNKLAVLLVLILSIGAYKVQSQSNPNYLTSNDYSNIQINGVTLKAINDSKGEANVIDNLFSSNFTYEEISFPDPYRMFRSLGMYISFDKNHLNEFEIAHLTVSSDNIEVKVGNNTIRVGDSIDSLGAVNITNDDAIIYEIGLGNGSNLLSQLNYFVIRFNKFDRKIEKIELIVLT